MIISMFMSRQKRDCWSLMLWSRKVRQLTISFRNLARSKLWDGRRVDSVTGQSAPGVHSHIANSCPSKTFIHGRRNSNVSTWIKLSARFKTFFKPWQIVYVDTSGKWRSKSSRSNHYHTVFVCARSGFKLTFPHKKAISLSAGLHEIRCSNWQSSAASNLGQGMRDQYKSSIHCCWQKAVNTSVFQKQASQFRCTWKGYRRPGKED